MMLLEDKRFPIVAHYGIQLAVIPVTVVAIPCSRQTNRKVRTQSHEASEAKNFQAGRVAVEESLKSSCL